MSTPGCSDSRVAHEWHGGEKVRALSRAAGAVAKTEAKWSYSRSPPVTWPLCTGAAADNAAVAAWMLAMAFGILLTKASGSTAVAADDCPAEADKAAVVAVAVSIGSTNATSTGDTGWITQERWVCQCR